MSIIDKAKILISAEDQWTAAASIIGNDRDLSILN